MPTSAMRTAVLQATAIYLLSEILNHHLSYGIFDQIMDNEGVRNFTAVMNKTSSMVAASSSATSSQLSLDAGRTMNSTLSFSNNTSPNTGTGNATKTPPEAFYSWRLPREVIIYMLISILQYYWLIWLERTLPARPRRRDVVYAQGGESGDREEEIVKKWIVQGRVNRASLNWCNTFLKWVLDLTIGRLWYHSIEHVIRVFLKLQSPTAITQEIASHLAYNFFGTYFSIAPLATLIAFIAVPAINQIVFMAGAKLVGSIFMTMIIRIFATWAVKTDFAQSIIRNVTEGAEERLQQGKPLHDSWPHMNEL